MPVIRNRPHRYLVADLNLIEDESVSDLTKKLYLYAIKNRNDWVFRRKKLLEKLHCGKDSLRESIDELRRLGYLTGYFRDPEQGNKNTLTVSVAPVKGVMSASTDAVKGKEKGENEDATDDWTDWLDK